MNKIAVRNYNGHFLSQLWKHTKIQEFINRTRLVKIIAVNIFFCLEKTESWSLRVPSGKPSRATSGTRTTVWEPLNYREYID